MKVGIDMGATSGGTAAMLDLEELLATRLDDRRFQVVTLAPLVLHAEHFGLEEGVEALRVLTRPGDGVWAIALGLVGFGLFQRFGSGTCLSRSP